MNGTAHLEQVAALLERAYRLALVLQEVTMANPHGAQRPSLSRSLTRPASRCSRQAVSQSTCREAAQLHVNVAGRFG